jgi:hypothetical protein
MATAVLLIILAAVLVAGVRFWRLSQSDRRSVDQYHTRIERMQQMDGLRSVEEPFGDGSPDDPATPHIRILRTDEPSGEGASKRPRAAAPEVEAEVTGWGPPVRLLAEPKPEREYMVEPALAPAPVPHPMPPPSVVSAPSAPSAAPSAAPEGRRVLFFDDFATAAAAQEREPAHRVIPVRPGDRPWLGTARQYAFPGAAALSAAVVLIALAVAATSSGGGGQVVSSGRLHRTAAPGARSVGVRPPSSQSPSSSSGPSSPAPTPTPTPTPASPAVPSATAGGPQLTLVFPSSGAPGQQVTLAGAGLFSSDGLIVVRFGATPASVVCPNQTTCRAIVPGTPDPATTAVQTVTVSTETGTSNGLRFTYRT